MMSREKGTRTLALRWRKRDANAGAPLKMIGMRTLALR
jgi:hypothetical protein